MNYAVVSRDSEIRAFNDSLAKQQQELKDDQYTRLIMSELFSDMTNKQLIDEMLKIATTKGITIRDDALAQYGAVSQKYDAFDIRSMVESHKMKEGIHFVVVKEKPARGPAKTVYLFSADAFLLLLGRNKHTDEYLKIYVFTFCISKIYYVDYQSKVSARAIGLVMEQKDNKIDDLTKTLSRIELSVNSKFEALSKQNDRILGKNQEMLEMNDELKTTIDDLGDELAYKIERLSEASHRQVIPTSKEKDTNCLLVIRKLDNFSPESDFEYHVIRSNDHNYSRALKRISDKYLGKIEIVLVILYVPNAIMLWKQIKEELTTTPNFRIVAKGQNGFDIRDPVGYGVEGMKQDFLRIHNLRKTMTLPIDN